MVNSVELSVVLNLPPMDQCFYVSARVSESFFYMNTLRKNMP